MIEEWIQKIWFIYTLEYYSVVKNEDILTFAGKWMELENILSEVTQTQKDMHGITISQKKFTEYPRYSPHYSEMSTI